MSRSARTSKTAKSAWSDMSEYSAAVHSRSMISRWIEGLALMNWIAAGCTAMSSM